VYKKQVTQLETVATQQEYSGFVPVLSVLSRRHAHARRNKYAPEMQLTRINC